MTKIMTFFAAVLLVVGMTLCTPAKSEAGPLRDRWQQGQGFIGWLRDRPGLASGQWEGPGLFSGDRLRNYFSNYYRVGNVIINGNKWGDLGYRVPHSDLIRW
ncbi:MAG TPA: hypothetical protein VKS79_19760 [Gemmataceae bacterium]|nr:hypothetical protein [Gemmataceae bacterium]